MTTFRQLVFNKQQNKFMRLMLKMPFIQDLNAGGWILHPLTGKTLAGACDYRAPRFVGVIIDFVVYHILEDHDSLRNQEACLRYGLIEENSDA